MFCLGLQAYRLQHKCFPVKFAKFLRTLILKNICEWLLLQHINPLAHPEKYIEPMRPMFPFYQSFICFKQSCSRLTFVAGTLKEQPIRNSHRRCSINLYTYFEKHLQMAFSEPMIKRKSHPFLETKNISYKQ